VLFEKKTSSNSFPLGSTLSRPYVNDISRSFFFPLPSFYCGLFPQSFLSLNLLEILSVHQEMPHAQAFLPFPNPSHPQLIFRSSIPQQPMVLSLLSKPDRSAPQTLFLNFFSPSSCRHPCCHFSIVGIFNAANPIPFLFSHNSRRAHFYLWSHFLFFLPVPSPPVIRAHLFIVFFAPSTSHRCLPPLSFFPFWACPSKRFLPPFLPPSLLT